MWDRKSLVQIQMADVCIDYARGSQAQLSVHIGTVEVDLTTIGVDEVVDLFNSRLKNSMCARVGDHSAGNLALILFTLGSNGFDIYVARAIARNGHDLQPTHDSCGWVRTVRGCGDQADVAVALSKRLMILLDGHYASELSVGSTVRLE